MEIAVCVKRVPHTNTRIRIADSGDAIDPTDVELTFGPYDEFALELALRLKEATKAKLTVVCLDPGGAAAVKSLRDCLAKGADKALLLKADTSATDSFGVARALADALGELGPDLVLTGYKAVDDDAAQVGSALATLLDWPAATEATAVEVADGKATATCGAAEGTATVELTLPAVVTVGKTPYELRVSKMRDIMMAKKKPLDERDVTVQPAKTKVTKLSFPPERAAGRKIESDAGEAADAIVAYIKNELKLL